MSPSNSRSNSWWIALAVIVVLGLLWWGYRASKQSSPAPAAQEQSTPEMSNNGAPAESLTATLTTKPHVKKPAPKASARYQTALATYRYKIQFDECHGNPGELTFKKGDTLMLDNRDDVEHTFVVAHTGLNIRPWNFAIITADTLGRWYITCDGGGAAVIDVQP